MPTCTVTGGHCPSQPTRTFFIYKVSGDIMEFFCQKPDSYREAKSVQKFQSSNWSSFR
jgi:hypothetical protein